MRTVAALIACLLIASCASIPPGTPEISSQELIAAPEKYDGKLVLVRGQVSYGFEDCMVDGRIWYWPRNRSCYAAESFLDAWTGRGYVLGVVSTKEHGHLGEFPFSIIQARAVGHR